MLYAVEPGLAARELKCPEMVILFGLARRTARNSGRYRYFTGFEPENSGVLRREFPEALELAGQDFVRSRVVVCPEQPGDQKHPVVRLEQRIDDRSVIVEHMRRFARRVRAGAVGRDLPVVAHPAAIHVPAQPLFRLPRKKARKERLHLHGHDVNLRRNPACQAAAVR